jgi:hypothetical protein
MFCKKRFYGETCCFSNIKTKKTRRKERPINEISQSDINEFLAAIKNIDQGFYPKIRDLRKMLPSFTPLQLNLIIRYLERSGTIIIDNEGYIVWSRREKEEDTLTLGDIANVSDELKEYLKKSKYQEEQE